MKFGDPGFFLTLGDLVRWSVAEENHLLGVVIAMSSCGGTSARGLAWVTFPSPVGDRVIYTRELEIVSKVKKKINKPLTI